MVKTLSSRPLSEVFISVLLDPDTTDSRHVKKAVVRMAELIAALVTIHGLMTFLQDMYSFLDPPGGTVGLSVYHCCLRPEELSTSFLLMGTSERGRNVKDFIIVVV